MPAAIVTLVLAVAFAASPYFSAPFMGYRPDQLPIPQPEPPVQPAGYAFAIWIVVYGWLIVSAAWGVWKRADDPLWAQVRWPLMVSLALGVPWTAIANASAVWSTIVIFLMLIFAVAALVQTPETDRWWLRVPVALYAGWLTAASFASLGVVAAGYGLFFGPVAWAWVCIGLALVLALTVQRQMPKAPEYGLAVIWALVAIAVRNGGDQVGVTAIALAGALAIAAVGLRGAMRPA